MKNIKKLALVLLILLVSPLITAIAICRFYLSSIESAALGFITAFFIGIMTALIIVMIIRKDILDKIQQQACK